MKEIIYEDQDIIVCLKAPGVPVQSDLSNDKDLASMLDEYMRKKGLEKPYIGLVHRLDRPVGGLVVFGKTPQATAHLSKQLQARTFKKTYLAVVKGTPEDQTLVHFLKKKFKGNVSSVVDQETPKAKRAVMHIKRLKTMTIDDEIYSLISIELETGRHHQIRVQLSHIGHPIWGDTKYHPDFMTKKGWFQIALFSNEVTFVHPKKKSKMTHKASPSDYPFNL
ncbi:RluA family pseudouridine synthase [Acidaminobacter sp. JC074]|uniref:RluA family pseudouridine synthase n=1 Tax=Acidaminobacter sp. JC074 TaxID=2530199 RepID=UPI001F0F2436|nr:RluA family pseudouridine synthase [Acidaminobacter sp. JC074]MCH4886600.1 RluA family pseudouridine synthase [Acidaminobacter sp. JC074]